MSYSQKAYMAALESLFHTVELDAIKVKGFRYKNVSVGRKRTIVTDFILAMSEDDWLDTLRDEVGEDREWAIRDMVGLIGDRLDSHLDSALALLIPDRLKAEEQECRSHMADLKNDERAA